MKSLRQPWKNDQLWQDFKIRSAGLGKHLKNFFTLLVLCLILVPVPFLIINDAESWVLKLGAIILAFLSCVGLIVSARKLIAAMRFGRSELVFSQLPLIPGRESNLKVILPAKVKKSTYHLRWYQKKIWPKTLPGDEVREKIELEQNAKVDLLPGNRVGERLFAEFALMVPENAETTQHVRIPHVEWWLRVSAPGETFNYSCEFQLPVFKVVSEDCIEKNPAEKG